MKPKLLAVVSTVLAMAAFLVIVSQSERAAQGQAARQRQANRERPEGNQPAQALELRQGSPNVEFLQVLHQQAREGGADVLSAGDSADDFASVAQTSDGTIYAAYAAYYDGHDQVRLHRRLESGDWSTYTYVPLAQSRADIWMPQLAVDAGDRVWVVWSEQVGSPPSQGGDRGGDAESSGNWDLYARPLVRDENGERWGALVRLTTDSKPDINPHIAVDHERNIHVVWQAHPNNDGDVYYCRFDGKDWSQPLAVSADSESDWYPRVAVDRKGTAWIAFDSYRNGDYDVFLTSVKHPPSPPLGKGGKAAPSPPLGKGGVLGFVIPIATSGFYEAHASVACTPDGKVWVAWEQGGFNWGKDQGYWLNRQNRNQGTTLGSRREVKVACWENGELHAAPDVADALEADRQQPSGSAELAAGPDGRLWLRFRHIIRGRQRRPNRFTRGWTETVTHLTGEGWAAAKALQGSTGRISVFSRILPAADDSLWVAYSGDARAALNYHRPVQDTALIIQLDKPEGDAGTPELAKYEPPAPPAAIPQWNAGRETRQVERIREHRVEIDGQPHRIVRGDLHRHTELSWDVGPGNDGSYLDFYRYMIDVAAMDFGSLTDHQGGGHYAYWWWLTQKSADMYYLAPRFVPLYGYERSARFPNGHRNIFHAYRGVPVFPFQLKTDQTGFFPAWAQARWSTTTRSCCTNRCTARAAWRSRIRPAPIRWAPTGATTIPKSSRSWRSIRAPATATRPWAPRACTPKTSRPTRPPAASRRKACCGTPTTRATGSASPHRAITAPRTSATRWSTRRRTTARRSSIPSESGTPTARPTT
ncbi:MAG: hypothetical protein KY476_03095 [Planctomycetes bacterium]|nr:hypothetical protein [Planctomycetota bacterium]